MRSSVKILDEVRHLDAEESKKLTQALKESTSGITTLRRLLELIQSEEGLYARAEELVRTGNAPQAVHHYEDQMLMTRGTIHHLITELDKEVSALDTLVRDLHRLDERIGERMQTLRRATGYSRRAA